MSLNNPQSRSALRAIIFAVVILGVLGFAWFFSFRLSTEQGLREVIRYAFMILLVGTLGYITETGIRSIKAKGLLGDIELNANAPDAAQKVADTAQDAADEIKESSSKM